MSAESPRPKSLWNQKNHTASVPSVDAYFDLYEGEFNTDLTTSEYAYGGKASAAFRLVTKMNEWEAKEERFEGKGNGCWTLRSDRILNNLTADLLAAAEALGGRLSPESLSSGSSIVWVALLDGGVGVYVDLWQHWTTNRMHGRQRTTVRGPRAYRALLELLGFDWINRKLEGETLRPSHAEIKLLVSQSLAEVRT